VLWTALAVAVMVALGFLFVAADQREEETRTQQVRDLIAAHLTL